MDAYFAPVEELVTAKAAAKASIASVRWEAGDLFDHKDDEGVIRTWRVDQLSPATETGRTLASLAVVRRLRPLGGDPHRDVDLAWVPRLRMHDVAFPGLSDKKRLLCVRGDRKSQPKPGEEAHAIWRPAHDCGNWDEARQRPVLPWILFDFVEQLGAPKKDVPPDLAFLRGVWSAAAQRYVKDHSIDLRAAAVSENDKMRAHAQTLGVTDPADYLVALTDSLDGDKRREADALIGSVLTALYVRS